MKRISKRQLSNIGFILLLGLFFLTPLGFHVKVLVNRIVSFSPPILSAEEQLEVTDFNWHLRSLNGDSFDFKTAKEKVVFVNFWATWCPPCVAEMPDLQELYSDYSEEVVFLFVAHDEQENVSDFLEKKDYKLPVYFESSPTPEIISPEYLPTTYIIDKQGKLKVVKTGAANWNSEKIRTLLDELLGKN